MDGMTCNSLYVYPTFESLVEGKSSGIIWLGFDAMTQQNIAKT